MESNSPSSERNLFGRTSRVPNLLPEIFSDSQLLNFTVFRHNKKLIWFLCFLFAKIFIDKLLCAIRLLKFIVIIKVLRYYVQTPATSENFSAVWSAKFEPKAHKFDFPVRFTAFDLRVRRSNLEVKLLKSTAAFRYMPVPYRYPFFIRQHRGFACTESSADSEIRWP